MFEDRRKGGDRRGKPCAPVKACRRNRDRRSQQQRYAGRPWWLAIDYVEAELEPPLLIVTEGDPVNQPAAPGKPRQKR